MRIEELTIAEWERNLPESGFSVFHTPEALEVLEKHSPGDLRLYGGFKGEQPIALLPVFVRRNAVGRAVLSPPPSRNVPNLGPILMPTSPKRLKRERVNRRFTQQILEECGVDSRRTLFRMICSPPYRDPRPYSWADLDVETTFTYVLDIDSSTPDELMDSFSSSLRREIRNAEELDIRVGVENEDAVPDIYDLVQSRYRDQGESTPLTAEYVDDVATELGDRSRVYVVRAPDGEFLNGIVVLYSNDTAYFWLGGTRTTYEDVSINSLLHWRIITDIAEDPELESISEFDLVGANTERLCKYKAKFGAELVPYYVIESAGTGMNLAKRAHELVP
jgi:hypothetical protein